MRSIAKRGFSAFFCKSQRFLKVSKNVVVNSVFVPEVIEQLSKCAPATPFASQKLNGLVPFNGD